MSILWNVYAIALCGVACVHAWHLMRHNTLFKIVFCSNLFATALNIAVVLRWSLEWLKTK